MKILSKDYQLIKIFIFIANIKVILYKDIDNIRLGIYTYALKGGGTERITALMLNYLSKESNFYIYVFSQRQKEENEFKIPEKIKRTYINAEHSSKKLRTQLKVKKIIFTFLFFNLDLLL
jgi:hypothetical protein